jgi:hypothetical protein
MPSGTNSLRLRPEELLPDRPAEGFVAQLQAHRIGGFGVWAGNLPKLIFPSVAASYTTSAICSALANILSRCVAIEGTYHFRAPQK